MSLPRVVIIGGGPAGLAAAMQLSRQGIPALVFERSRVGGLLRNANWVENYPGFAEGISGPDLVRRMAEQAERLGVQVILEEVQRAAYQEEGFFSLRTDRDAYQASLLVAATGTRANLLPPNLFPGAAAEKVFSEVAPLLGMQGKEILVVGSGDAALDYALNLARHNRVSILNRGTEIRGLALLWERVQEHPAISYYAQTEISGTSLRTDDRLQVSARQGGREISFVGDWLLTAIGRYPDYSFADESIMEDRDRLLADQKLFLIGDLINSPYRQTALAVGDGIRTAMMIGGLVEKGIS